MVLCSIALHAKVVTGTCGDNLTWSYDTDTKALTIEGTGDMSYDAVPWEQVNGDILSVSLPDGLTSIGGRAFNNCSSLTSITIPNSVTSIGYEAFYGCSSLTSITIPNSVTSIGGSAFAGCSSLTSVTWNVKKCNDFEWYNYPFADGNNILSFTFGEGVESIPACLCKGLSNITSIILPNSVTSIGGEAFSGCSSLTSVTLGNSVTSIGRYAFWHCSSLTSVTLGNSVTSIGESAFEDCSSLTSITIPNSVTSIGGNAFSSCAQVTVECTTPPTIESGTFKSDATISVPCFTMGVYLATPVWQFLSIVDDGTYRINLSATEGGKATITATDCDANTATIEAVADNLYQFSQWSDGNTDNPRTLTLTQDTTLQAIFGPTPSYSVTLRGNSIEGQYQYIDDWGDISNSWFSQSEVNITVREGLSVNFHESNMECGTWLGWSDGVTDNERTITITSDTVITSIFDVTTYQVNISAAEHGSLFKYGNPIDNIDTTMTDCDGQGETIYDICAYPDEGYYFAGWSDGNTEQCRTFTITQDTTITALFKEIKYYSVTLRGNSIRGYYQYIEDWGDISKTWFNDDSEINITVREGLSVYFYEDNMNCGTWLGWSDGVTDYERTITITSDTIITSLFDVTTYQVNIYAGENGVLRVGSDWLYWDTDTMYYEMTDCDNELTTDQICAVPDEGYYFTGWSDGNTERCRNFTITQDTTITALFEEIKYCSVTLRGNSIRGYYQYIDDLGDISGSWFGYDSEINIAVPEGLSVYFYEDNMNCGTWLGWSDGVTDNERTITITCDTVITSRFDVPTYQVNISAAEHGSLTQYEEPIGNIETTMTDCDSDGEWIHICAVPEDGYYFTGWSDGYAYACRSIKVLSDTTLVAHFAKKQQVQVLVGVESACKNMGTVSGSGIFYQGDVVTITATPNSGYHFVEWSDGNSIANREIYLTSDTTLFATFAAGDMGGKCGDNLYWTWDKGALTITGSGDMDLQNHPAWWQYEEIQITSVSMPEGMTSIYAWAFYEQPITTILIPASVEEVGDRAFADNNRLTHFEYLGNNIHWGIENSYWEYRPLYGCYNLQYFRGNLELGGDYCTMIDTVIISNGQALDDWYDAVYVDNTNASDSIIRGEYDYVNAVRTLYLPAGLVEIGDYALHNARFLGGITIPAGVTRIGISAFEDCRSMDSVVFAGNNVEEIGDWAFYNCHSLRSLTLPEGVEEIGRAAFFDCTYLNELTIPSTMKKIADNGFAGCEKMQTMYVNALVPPTIEAKTFEDVNRATPVFVPKGTLERYQADEYWSEFFNMAEYEAPTGNLNTAADDDANGLRKVVRDGQVLIIRGDKTYTILGETIQ